MVESPHQHPCTRGAKPLPVDQIPELRRYLAVWVQLSVKQAPHKTPRHHKTDLPAHVKWPQFQHKHPPTRPPFPANEARRNFPQIPRGVIARAAVITIYWWFP